MAIREIPKIFLYLFLGLIIVLILLITSPKFGPRSILNITSIDDNGNVFGPEVIDNELEKYLPSNNGTLSFEESELEESKSEASESTSEITFALLIRTTTTDLARRKLIRNAFFGIQDNLVPCLQNRSANVWYKFLVRKSTKSDGSVLRKYKSEFVEFGDLADLEWENGEEILKWASENINVTYTHLLTIDIHTLISLKSFPSLLNNQIISSLTPTKKRNILWGAFTNPDIDTMAILTGIDAIPTLISDSKKINSVSSGSTSFFTKAYSYYTSLSSSSIIPIHDTTYIKEYQNIINESLIPRDTTLIVGHIYQDQELIDLIDWLQITPINICNQSRISSDNPARIAITTSSFVYSDMCMISAVIPSAENKAVYAKKHGYTFLARSHEFSQQSFKNRKNVWGKIDIIEKALQKYEWVFWIDMDAIIVNYEVKVEELLLQFEKMTERWEDIGLVITQPKGDGMINAGVFLIRQGKWAQKYLRRVQQTKEGYWAKYYEQKVMWDVMNEKEFKDGVLSLEDDHIFNIFPKRYQPGDFIVHFAPDKCPADLILRTIDQVLMIEKGEKNLADIDFVE